MTTLAEAYFGHVPAPAAPPLSTGTPLHLNEMPADVPLALRRRILAQLRRVPLNRYPEPFADSLATQLAAWYGCRPGQLLVGPGSSSFIRLLFTYFGLHARGHIVIARPSFAYYEQFCRAFNIPYRTWELDDNFQYDTASLADLPDHSAVWLASPNNPTGDVIPTDRLAALLGAHPRSLFVVDEAYGEFAGSSLLPLLAEHPNLLLLRTLSKVVSAASLRCGALMGDESLIAAIRGLQTPWQMSGFTIEAAKVILSYIQETSWATDQIRALTAERDQLSRRWAAAAGQQFTVYPSRANFILLRAASPKAYHALLAACARHGLLVAALDGQPRLSGCVRVTIGRPADNVTFTKAFQESLSIP
ncbi:MAG TPA: aminotransferase class I/II-fold pyridoxal phosphate-dependent enzyme [Candidatus Saccharimonadia bacterium]|nr:aminotransferase class I/II-fold pyridoxal phosphate-dependent enzyme [Candidatus Saccharimonadia bacterium]